MKTPALIIGLTATTFFLLGYLMKSRKRIILFNVTSRVLYILQYVLLGAFEGAALDIAGAAATVFAQKKDLPFIKKHLKLVFAAVNIIIIITGLLLYKNIYSLLPIMGVMLHTGAFWLDDEKYVRRVSLIGSPFWLVYNFVSGAYGSCVGDTLSIIFLISSIYRYDIKQ